MKYDNGFTLSLFNNYKLMIPCRYIFSLTLLLSISAIDISSQVPVVKKPQPATIQTGVIVGYPDSRVNSAPNVPSFPAFNNRNQQQMDMYERDRLEVEHRNMQMQQMADEALAGFPSIQYELPSWSGAQGTEHYYQTAEKLLNMLNGKTPLNLKDAVFSVENAYFEGQLDKRKYEENISRMATIARLKAGQDGLNWNNPITKNLMLYRVMADTLSVKFPMRERASISFPMQYDFDDFRGEQDFSKLFVTKLLSSHKGQCHSLPLLYLILCEKVGAEASLAFSPQHSYIKFKDKNNNWYNLELTQGMMTTDAFIVGSGFINAAAIKHGVYMQPQDKKQVIAQCLSDLASGYIHKYGYDKFVIQCIDSVLAYAPTNTSALAMKSNYHSIHLSYAAHQVGSPPPDTLKVNYPYIYKLYEERNNVYRKLDEIGFVEMPKEVYENWLNSVNEEKERREHDIRYKSALRLIE
jgi:cell division protein FtsL